MTLMSRRLLIVSLIAALAAESSCHNPEAPAAAYVKFRLDSPFCGPQKYGLRFIIDQTVAGSDSLANGQYSASFSTTPGSHLLRGVMTGGGTATGDTTVVLKADSTFTAVVNFYCS
jgi:hypothetical protein